MTKRNKRSKVVVLRDSPTCEGVIPIIIKPSQSGSLIETKKCNCGDAIADTVNGTIGCIRYPECCDEDLVLVELTDYEGLEFIEI
jgi:hypothetical protein